MVPPWSRSRSWGRPDGRKDLGHWIIRVELVRFATAHGVKPATRHFATTPKTVWKWLCRGQAGTLQGMEDHSRPPPPFRRIPC